MNIDMIRAADARLAGRVRRTPLLSSPFLDDIAGKRVLVKPECLQHTGSFKFRGAWSAISNLTQEQGQSGVTAFSSGNHAQGVAYAAQQHGYPAVILMPSDAPALKIANTKALGAEVVLYDRHNESREDIGTQLAKDRNLTLIKPFDDPDVIAGQGSVGLEIAQQAAEMGIDSAEVLVPCGGGGLTGGIALALQADAPHMRARPVEPFGFDDVARSLLAGEIKANPTQSGSICDAILTVSPGPVTFPILQSLCGPGLVVSDDDALRAMAAAFTRLKVVAEPGGAVALAAALYQAEQIENDTVIAVISGGNVDANLFSEALGKYGI